MVVNPFPFVNTGAGVRDSVAIIVAVLVIELTKQFSLSIIFHKVIEKVIFLLKKKEMVNASLRSKNNFGAEKTKTQSVNPPWVASKRAPFITQSFFIWIYHLSGDWLIGKA